MFTIEQLRPIREGMTISRNAQLGEAVPVTYFSLGAGTTISQESYDHLTLYIGAAGITEFIFGDGQRRIALGPDRVLFVPGTMLCGMESKEGSVYTEIILSKEITMNAKVTPGQALNLKDLISYEEGSIANLDIVSTPDMKYVLMAFDEGTGLTPHRAPGNAIVFALEGQATIGYEGEDTVIKAGECFRFEKNGLHSVTANGRFKMALLLVME